MFINPTIDFLAQRGAALVAQLTDKDTKLPVQESLEIMTEYNTVAAAMRVARHPSLVPAAAVYSENKGTLWAWHCHKHRLHESHNGMTLCAMARQ